MAVSLRVGLIGHGAIGRAVGRALVAGEVPGAVLSGVTTRESAPPDGSTRLSIDGLVDASDLVVEVAGQAAVAEHGAKVLGSGRHLLVVSTGAMVDPALRAELQGLSGAGRLLVSTGAIGGLELLRAARRLGPFDRLRLTTSKRPGVLAQPWMEAALLARLSAGTERVVLYRGGAADAARLFPASVNVAATIALVLDAWEDLQVEVIADPAATLTMHRIEAAGPAGHHRIEIENTPSPENPATSALVAQAVLRAIADLAGGQMAVV